MGHFPRCAIHTLVSIYIFYISEMKLNQPIGISPDVHATHILRFLCPQLLILLLNRQNIMDKYGNQEMHITWLQIYRQDWSIWDTCPFP